MTSRRKFAFVALSGLAVSAAVLAVAVPLAVEAAGEPAPIARYDMRAGTVSGMGAMGGGMGGAMSMMFGGGRGNNAQHELYLRLGSSNASAKGAPKADHFMPPSAKLGKSVALVTPREEKAPDILPEKPKGRLLIFWGCGEHAPKGQPIVLDFAKVAAGQVPAGMPGSAVIRDWGPSLTNSKTFARWPAEDGKYVKADSSLPGPHKVVSNYAPEINFTLTKDFMAPLSTRTATLPSGASRVGWTGIAGATSYLAFVFGGKQGPGGSMGDMVMWTSSSDKQFGGGLADWISPGQVPALIRSGTLMPASATSCVVPAEVVNATPDFRVGTLTAFGPEEDFVYPPRPADPKVAWKPEWTARIRHRSTTSWMQAAGMSMGMQGQQQQEGSGQSNCKPRGGLGGMLGGALGGGGKGC
ncbi:hypothetical protein [Novosphingobium album (ex Liu et al. 2023)]|uniref:DUF4185 domain-containing protein n=1 Tax=Novosphingobium album (ex Liu et al. 2023) TaxID=3031130 RepID=A0ABT5WUY0_9SPHN|nr:hypothetical protein [Novosphingobium album (ex Liu et al. 2023)]MDE8653672.1 hypothetical protein [Novosphingobium album (ex Liu et al. 2023)]